MEIVQKIFLAFTIIGAINWGLIGLLDFNLITMLFGVSTILTKIIYILVGISGIVNIALYFSDFVFKKD